MRAAQRTPDLYGQPQSRDFHADRLFSALREASVTGGATFLGAGISRPWNNDPPLMQSSAPCYIYDRGYNRMGRGIVDDPAWFLGEMQKIRAKEQQEIHEKTRRGGQEEAEKAQEPPHRHAGVHRARDTELRSAGLPELPWKTEPVSWTSEPCVEYGCDCRVVDTEALEVHYGLILLTSGPAAGSGGYSGEEGEEDQEADAIDYDLYDRVGVFEVYGAEFASDRPKRIYIR
ncbi:hypothetical protein PG994_008990 [Apiospora phragmitis]|uniref:Uncharacterized protein n=1 Tax=Apiospora phragmitis TaxID=2905665 RepID=A0ABR1UI06_9PEZI